MKIVDSKIFDAVNSVLAFVQSKTDSVRNNSLILSNIDYLIFVGIILTFFVSLFAKTEVIGLVSAIVPALVVLKVLMTKGEKIELEKSNFFLLVYLLICLISNFTSSMLPQSLYGFMKTLIYFAFYFAMCQFFKNAKQFIVPVLGIIAMFVTFESIVGIHQNIFGVESISTWQDTSYVNPEDVISRVYGTLVPLNPNLFGGYLIAGFSAVIGIFALLLTKVRESYKYLGLAVVALVAVLSAILAIFFTGCRGAYLALFVIFLFIVLASFQIVFFDLKSEKIKRIWQGLVALGSCCAVGFLAVHHGILKRIMSIFILRGDSSTSFRMNVYNSAIEMFKDNFLCGIGVGNKVFREIYGLYMLSGFDALSTYCVFLEIAVESGIFALISFVLFLYFLLSSAVNSFVKSSDLKYKILIFVSFISILAVMFHGIFDTIYFRPQVQYIFWTMVAILTILTREEKTAN